MNTVGYYKLYESGADNLLTVLIGMNLESAYEVASELAAENGFTVNVWRDYGEHMAMLGSVYQDGRIVGVHSSDTWELTMAAMG